MIKVEIKVRKNSYENMIKKLHSIGGTIQNNSGVFLTEIAENIMAESKMEVPIDTGTLRDSAFIQKPIKTSDGTTVVKMGYGGMNDKKNPDSGKMASEYALAVHELKTYTTMSGKVKRVFHPYGKWKFLEDPLTRQARSFAKILGVKIGILLQKGGKLINV